MTSTNEEKIQEIAKQIREIVGKNFTGSIEFHCVSERNEVKYIVKMCGSVK